MSQNVGYFYIEDKKIVAKIDGNVPYIYNNGWKPDNLIINYFMGSNLNYKEITKQEALKITEQK